MNFKVRSDTQYEWDVIVNQESLGRTTTANRYNFIQAAHDAGKIFEIEDIEFRLVKKETVV